MRIDRDELGSASEAGIEVRVEDGRLGLAGGLDDGSRDLIVGDAFGGVSVPWHLTTVESLTDIRRVLKKRTVCTLLISSITASWRSRVPKSQHSQRFFSTTS